MGTHTDLSEATLSTTISEVMGDVLTRAPLAADENFFSCGGDSLRAIEVLQRLAARDGVGASLGTTEMQAILLESIFEDASPGGLAKVAATNL